MILEKRVSLENLLTTLLSRSPGLSVQDILTSLKRQRYNYSQRGVYKELKKLEEQEIVYKIKTKYYLRLTWVVNLLSYAEDAYSTYTSPLYLGQLLTTKAKINQKFLKLRKLDLYWMQLMIAMYKLYPNESMYLWCPFHWFHLVHDYSVKQFYRAVEIEKRRRYHIVGSNTYIDRQATSLLPNGTKFSFAKSNFNDEINSYYTLIGDHLITVRLSQKTSNSIFQLFQKIKSDKDFIKNQQLIAETFNYQVNATLLVELNKKKANKYRKIFTDFWGE